MKKKENTFEEMSVKEQREVLRKQIERERQSNFDDLSIHDLKLLSVIYSTEEMGFFDLCSALRKIDECPVKGDKAGWASIFKWLGDMEIGGWILVDRIKGKLESLVLSDQGADAVRDFTNGRRPILVEAGSYSDKSWEENKFSVIGTDDDIPF